MSHDFVLEKKFSFDIHNINAAEIFIFSITEWTSCSSEENNVLRTLFEARKVAGSAKYKQSCVFPASNE